MTVLSEIGVVAIGRNEGERLKVCLRSVVDTVEHVVYVDSGSTDTSVSIAQGLGVEIVQLDLTVPFTAARARNAGFQRLVEVAQNLNAIFFIDGDCELITGFLDCAVLLFQQHSDIAIVAGRLIERSPEASIYNRLCDLEWTTQTGDVDAVGGIFVIRRSAFERVGGFNERLIAGEEPELCYRIRRQGGRVIRIPQRMAAHDAAMLRFGQWWKRSVRGGYAFAEGYALHGEYWRREVQSNWVWGLFIPVLILLSVWPTQGISLLGLGLYPVWMIRIARGRRRMFAESWQVALPYGFFCMLGKLPGMIGQLLYLWRSKRKKTVELIEYK